MLTATFYSYKGGVGRTTLLANVGAALSRDARVLLWDLDVEAPGLHHMPQLSIVPPPARGFLDWLADWQRHPTPSAAVAELAYLVGQRGVGSEGALYVLPAHGRAGVSAYGQIDWRRLLVTRHQQGIALFAELIGALGSSLSLDYLLIDARTGLTDLGGLLTALLPDVTVLVGGYGHQNVAGLAGIRRSLEKARHSPLRRARTPLELVQVVSPVPPSESDRAALRRKAWAEHFDAVPLEIPWHGDLLFEERLLVLDQPAHPVARAYLKVADRLAMRARELRPSARHDDDGRLTAIVEHLLRLLGFQVKARPDGLLDARFEHPFGGDRFLVRAADHLTDAHVRLDAEPGVRHMLVGRTVSPLATSSVDRDVTTLAALERRLWRPEGYLDRLRAHHESSDLARTYVAQRLQAPDGRPSPDASEAGLRWARGDAPARWLLLGDYGTGKSTFLQALAYRLALAWADDPEAPIPLRIPLTNVAASTTLEQLIGVHLRQVHDDRTDPRAILHLVRLGRVVLLLDGLDELDVGSSGTDVLTFLARIKRDVSEPAYPMAPRSWGTGSAPLILARPAAGDTSTVDVQPPGALTSGGRVIVTCRTHFFRDQDHEHTASETGFAPHHLTLFDDEQIQTFLVRTLRGDAVERAGAYIRGTYDLLSLAARPVWLDMIVQSLSTLENQQGAVTPTTLYRSYIDQWLQQRGGAQLRARPTVRALLLRRLAEALWRSDEGALNVGTLHRLVEQLGDRLEGLDAEQVDLELRSATFLTRTADGAYGFSHRSFLEYFLAEHLSHAVDARTLGPALDTEPLSTETLGFLLDLLDDRVSAAAAATCALLKEPFSDLRSLNALRLGHLLPGGLPRGARLETADLDFEDLEGADLRDAILRDTSLEGANLRGARLDGAELWGAVLDDADLTGASLRGARMLQASLRRATLDGAVLCDANLSGANLRESQAHDADWTGAEMTGVDARAGRWQRSTLHPTRQPNLRLHGARLHGASLQGLDRAQLAHATGPAPASVLPERTHWRTDAIPGCVAACFLRHARVLAAVTRGGTVWFLVPAVGAIGRHVRTGVVEVQSLQQAPDGSLLAVVGRHGVALLTETGEPRARRERGDAVLWQATFRGDGRLVIAWLTRDGLTLEILSTDGTLTPMQPHEADGWGVAETRHRLRSDGLAIAVGDDERVILWDLAGEVPRRGATAHLGDGLLAWCRSDLLVGTTAGDGQVLLIDGDTGSIRHARAANFGWTLLDDPLGQWVVYRASPGWAAWDARTGADLPAMEAMSAAWDLRFTPDGTRLVGGTGKGLIVMGRATGVVTQLEGGGPLGAFGMEGDLAFGVEPGGAILTWRLDEPEAPERRWDAKPAAAAPASSGVLQQMSAQGRCGTWGTTGAPEWRQALDEGCSRTYFNDGGNALVLTQAGELVWLGPDATDRMPVEMEHIRGFAPLSESLRRVLVGCWPEGRLVDFDGQRAERTSLSGSLSQVLLDEAGNLVVTIEVQRLNAFTLDTLQPLAHWFPPGLRWTATIDPRTHVVWVATTSGLLLWNPYENTVATALPTPVPRVLASHPIRGIVASGHADGSVFLWDDRTPTLLTRLERPIAALACSPAADTLAIVCVDGAVHFWSVAERTEWRTAATAWIEPVHCWFSPRSPVLWVTTADGALHEVDIETAEVLGSRLLWSEDAWASIDRRGQIDGTPQGLERLQLYEPEASDLVQTVWIASDWKEDIDDRINDPNRFSPLVSSR